MFDDEHFPSILAHHLSKLPLDAAVIGCSMAQLNESSSSIPASSLYSGLQQFSKSFFHVFQLFIFQSLFTPCRTTHNSCSGCVAQSKLHLARFRAVNRHLAFGTGSPLANTARPRSVEGNGRNFAGAASPAARQEHWHDQHHGGQVSA